MLSISKLAFCGFLFFCAISQLVGPPALSACGPDPKQVTDSRYAIPYKFVVDTGWEIPGLKNATLTEKRTDRFGREIWIYAVKHDNPSVALQVFQVDSANNTVHLVPGDNITAETIWEYRVQGRVYQYAVDGASTGKAQVPMWPKAPPKPPDPNAMRAGVLGCGWTIVRYTDQDGDGVFETLQYLPVMRPREVSSSDLIPDWALQLVPKKEELLKALRTYHSNGPLKLQGETF